MIDPIRSVRHPAFALSAGALFFVAGHLLCPFPSDPDAYFGLARLVGAFLVCCAWMLSVLCAGFSLTRFLPVREKAPFLWFALGTLLFVVITTLLGTLGFVGYGDQWLFIILLFGALASPLLTLGARKMPKSEIRMPAPANRGVENVALGCLAIVFISLFINA